MLLTVLNVLYILVAVAMIALILLQRGAGADAGSGFGGGASATVFGARGSASFLSRATAVLATLFFLLSLGMGIYLSASGGGVRKPTEELGVMTGTEVPAATEKAPVTKPVNGDVPQAPAPAETDKPVAPKADTPAAPVPAPVKDSGKTDDKKSEPKKNN